MLLYRLCHATRLDPEMVRFFYSSKSKISAIVLTFLEALYTVSKQYLSNPRILFDRFEMYIEVIQKKARPPPGGILRVWGFIDGTFRGTCRPGYNQRQAYSGHKRAHGLKFQSVVTPDGLIATLYGPVFGCRHDSHMLTKSRLLQKLQRFIPDNLPANERYALYGDPAYPSSGYLYSGYTNPRQNSPEARMNKKMSKVRQCVEWGFKDISSKWRLLNSKEQMKIYQNPVAEYYYVAAFLTNCITCIQGNQTSNYFQVYETNGRRLTLQQYLSLA